MVLFCCVDNQAMAMSNWQMLSSIPFRHLLTVLSSCNGHATMLLPGLKCFRMRNDPFLGIHNVAASKILTLHSPP